MYKSYIHSIAQYVRQLFFRRHPAFLVLFVTSRCNAKCATCFNIKNVLAADHDEMPLKSYQAIARQYGQLPQLLISGGEPFLRKDLPEIIESFYRYCGTRVITIPTNGMLYSQIVISLPEIIKRCPDATININISLDGISQVHDNFRGIPGAFDMVLKTFNWVKELKKKIPGLGLNISTTITPDNLEQMNNFISFVREELKPDTHIVGKDRAIINKNHIPKGKLYEVFKFLDNDPTGRINRGLLNKVLRILIRTIRDIDLEVLEKKNRPFNCLAGRKIIIISEKGEVYPCEPMWFPEIIRHNNTNSRPRSFSLGNLQTVDMNLNRLLNTPLAMQIFRWIDGKHCTCHYECAYYNSIAYSFWNYSDKIFKNIMRSCFAPLN